MGKHLKRLRAEKAKVQLKKKLPKGQNVTDTAFTVKKIVTPVQLPQRDGFLLTSKHQTLQDCLNYLTHHNVTKQLDGLRGVRELLRGGAVETSGVHLRQVVTRVLDVAVEDKDSKVRRSAIKVLTEAFHSTPSVIMAPFTPLLNKQLQRALSNINVDIQRDALRIVDLVLTLNPLPDVKCLEPLLLPLLRMLTMTGASAPPRVAVLTRLLATCEAVFALPRPAEHAPVKKIRCDERCGPLTSVYHHMASIPLADVVDRHSPTDDVRTLVDRLLRTSLAVWTEIAPGRSLAEDALEVLALLARLVLVLYRYVAHKTADLKNWFVESYREVVGRHLLSKFPYHGREETPAQTRQPDYKEPVRQGSLQLNAHLATLYMYLQPPRLRLLPVIDAYLLDAIAVRPVSPDVIVLLECLLVVKEHQKRLVGLVASGHLSQPDPRLQALLTRVAFDEGLRSCHHDHYFQEWVVSLVHTPGFGGTVAAMAARVQDPNLTKVLRSVMPQVVAAEVPDKNLLHALYWTCSRNELLAVRSSPAARSYLEQILGAPSG